MLQLTVQYAKRVGRQQSGEYSVPAGHGLLMSDDSFVTLLKPYVMQALYSKSQTMISCATRTLRHLALIHPKSTLPVFIEHVYPALTTLTQTHRMRAVLHSLSFLVHPLVSRRNYAAGTTCRVIWSQQFRGGCVMVSCLSRGCPIGEPALGCTTRR